MSLSTGCGSGGTGGQSPSVQQPTNKKQALRCDVCDKDFNGEAVLRFHLVGAKHAKAVAALESLAALRVAGQLPPDAEPPFPCAPCGTVLNSCQQLLQHVNGTKHKEAISKPAGRRLPSVPANQHLPRPPPPPPPTGRTNGKEDEVDEIVKQLRMTRLRCDTCDVTANSQKQLEQHMTSARHDGRTSRGAVRGIGRGVWWSGHPSPDPRAPGRLAAPDPALPPGAGRVGWGRRPVGPDGDGAASEESPSPEVTD